MSPLDGQLREQVFKRKLRKVRRRVHAKSYAYKGSDRSKVTAPVAETADPLDVVGVSFLDREDDQCAWPIGDPRSPDFGCCGAPVAEGRSYCARHYDRAVDAVVPLSLSHECATSARKLEANSRCQVKDRESEPDLVDIFTGEAA